MCVCIPILCFPIFWFNFFLSLLFIHSFYSLVIVIVYLCRFDCVFIYLHTHIKRMSDCNTPVLLLLHNISAFSFSTGRGQIYIEMKIPKICVIPFNFSHFDFFLFFSFLFRSFMFSFWLRWVVCFLLFSMLDLVFIHYSALWFTIICCIFSVWCVYECVSMYVLKLRKHKCNQYHTKHTCISRINTCITYKTYPYRNEKEKFNRPEFTYYRI